MNKFSIAVKRRLLKIALSNPSPDRIPRSGDLGATVNCYTTRINRGEDDFLLAKRSNGDEIICLEWDGDRYSIESRWNFTDLLKYNFEFTHYYGLATISYYGWSDFAIGRIFRIPYIKAKIYRTTESVSQKLYNRRKLITKQRIDLLKSVLDAQTNGEDRVSSLTIMSRIHTIRWYLHPDSEAEHHRLKFYLDKLVEERDLSVNGIDYQITGKGISAIELYEEQERKHSEIMTIQRRMLFLTIVIAISALIQAQVIKLRPAIDFTVSSSRHN